MKPPFKPSIFIGSSTEGVKIAEALLKKLNSFAECKLWNGVFEIGNSTWEQLELAPSMYDYGIFVASGDDVTTSRKRQSMSPRDNVILEFGLFTGALGRHRSFLVSEDGVKLPTDILGITMPRIKSIGDKDFEKSITTCAKKIKEHIIDREQVFSLGLIPSTILAYGYFSNFIERFITRLAEDKKEQKVFKLGESDIRINGIRMTVYIPDDLTENMFRKVKERRLNSDWTKLIVAAKDERDYDFHIALAGSADGMLHIVDIPMTLNALNQAISAYSTKHGIGKTATDKFLETRELRNFKNTLDYLINTHSMTRNVVTTEIISL